MYFSCEYFLVLTVLLRLKMRFLFSIPIISIFFLLSGCASVQSSFTREMHIVKQSKTGPGAVEYLTRMPSRKAQRIGFISANGNGFSGFDDLIEDAREKAANLGGDFILVENSGVDTETNYRPGYSTFKADAYESYGSRSGQGEAKAQGYSVGPSVSTINRPWSKFSVWVYRPSQLGIRLDEANRIIGFHLNSDAEQAGLRIKDMLIGIDGYDILDEKAIRHLMDIYPGKKVKLTFQRGSERVEYYITALPN